LSPSLEKTHKYEKYNKYKESKQNNHTASPQRQI